MDTARDVFDTNLFAPMRLTQLVVPHMAERRSGLIINIGSVVGVVPTPWAGGLTSLEIGVPSMSAGLTLSALLNRRLLDLQSCPPRVE